MYISKEKAKKILDDYSRLTMMGSNLDTLEKLTANEIAESGLNCEDYGGEIYQWMGRNDQGPTYLNEEEAMSLIHGRNWAIDLF